MPTQGNNIYWSVENNAIGEAALIVINDFGEENIPGFLLVSPMRKGHVPNLEKDLTLHIAQKSTACSRLKTMVENDKIKICSPSFNNRIEKFCCYRYKF